MMAKNSYIANFRYALSNLGENVNVSSLFGTVRFNRVGNIVVISGSIAFTDFSEPTITILSPNSIPFIPTTNTTGCIFGSSLVSSDSNKSIALYLSTSTGLTARNMGPDSSSTAFLGLAYVCDI